MKEILEVVAKALVDHPDEFVVTMEEREDSILLNLKVAPSDMGKVIGKSGRIAKAIRQLLNAASVKEGKKVLVDIGE